MKKVLAQARGGVERLTLNDDFELKVLKRLQNFLALAIEMIGLFVGVGHKKSLR